MFLIDSWKILGLPQAKNIHSNEMLTMSFCYNLKSHLEQENPTYPGSLNKPNMVNRSVISFCPLIVKLIQSRQPRSDDNQEMSSPLAKMFLSKTATSADRCDRKLLYCRKRDLVIIAETHLLLNLLRKT